MIGNIMGKDYSGLIMCDGYNGYSERLYLQAHFGTCLVHIRREFVQATNLLDQEKLKHSSAFQAIKLLGKVFHQEKQLQYRNKEEKRRQRIKYIKPVLDKFYDYLQSINLPQGKLRAAINNAVKLRHRVYRVFENGQLPLSNNALENKIRFTTIIRKNCLFAKSVAGAEANAVYYTLIVTAKLNQLNVADCKK